MDRITFAMDSADLEIDAAMNRTGEFLQLTEHRLHAEVGANALSRRTELQGTAAQLSAGL